MGISVTHSTIHKKKKILVKQQEDRIKETAEAYTEQRKLILLGEAVIDSDSQRNDEILPCDHQSFAYLDILSAKSKLDILSNGCGATYSGYSKEIYEPVVFGGDVLTNERAFGAQLAMFNNKSEFENLFGVICRPEGLHRQMNFLLGIYQLFYKEKSSSDPGSLYQLRNLINRRDVTGPDAVTTAYRSHYHFVQDVLERYIVAAFLILSGLKDIDDTNCVGFPVFSIMSSEEQLQWILTQADAVMNNLGINET
nr:uncharacterized protein LOC117691932 [Crassostrea gigas]